MGKQTFETQNLVLKKCLACGKKFFISKSRSLDNRGKFCMMVCRRNYKYKLSYEFVLTEDLAELVGIIIGDGCVAPAWKRKDYRIIISGNPVEDKDYYDSYLPALIYRCLGIRTKPFFAKNGAYIIQFQYEPFRIYLHRLGVISPKSKTAFIPLEFKKEDKILLACIRGIADADFTFICTKRKKFGKNYYPRISAHFASKILVTDLEIILRSLGFSLNCKYDFVRNDPRGFITITNYINLDGPYNVERWMKLIGFSNSRILTRYLVWKRYNSLEPKTTLLIRKKLLMG